MINNYGTLANISRLYFMHDNLKISYLDNNHQSDDIPVFMLHGFTASAQRNWLESGWIAQLTKAGRRVIAIDARGHGDSDKPYDSSYYPSTIMMQDSIYLMMSMGFTQADFVGYSMGARMSAFAAIRYPKKVRKLLLGGMGINLQKGMSYSKEIADALLADSLKSVKNKYSRRFRRLAELGNNDLTALAYCILSSRQKIAVADLHKIIAKTLILVGDTDDIGGDPHKLSPYIGNSKAIEVPNCNHFNALNNSYFNTVGLDFIK